MFALLSPDRLLKAPGVARILDAFCSVSKLSIHLNTTLLVGIGKVAVFRTTIVLYLSPIRIIRIYVLVCTSVRLAKVYVCGWAFSCVYLLSLCIELCICIVSVY